MRGSLHNVDAPVFTSPEETVELFGIVAGVPAGTHVTIGYRTFVHGPSITNVSGETPAAAIPLEG